MHLPWKKGKLFLFFELMRGRRARLLITVLCAACAVTFQFLTPQVVRVTVDSVIDSKPFGVPAFVQDFINSLGGREFLRGALWIPALISIGMALIAGVANFFRRFFTPESANFMAKRLRDTLYAHIQRLPYAWHVKIQTGDIIQRCTSDVDTVREFMANQLGEMIRSVFLVTAALVLMFSMDVFMTLVTLSLLPIIFLFSWRFSKRVSKSFLRVDESEGELQSVVQENLTGVRVVRAFGRERFEIERFDTQNEKFNGLTVKLGNLLGNFWGLGDILTGLQILLTVVVGILRCNAGELSLGTFQTFYVYSNMMVWPVRNLGRLLTDMSKAFVSLGRLREILTEEPEADAPDAKAPEIEGEIVFDRVTFGYGDQPPVLRDVSFTLKPGQTLAILGGTGSGKSSLAHLLCRLYDLSPAQGSIRIDGTPINEIRRDHLRRHVGLVLQEPFLFSKTIRQNITAAKPNAELELIRAKAEIAAIHDSIEAFGQGYDTLIGERGVTLSGGQRQRVAIARMLMQEAPIMIFDDSLSAVDTETDARIRDALYHHTKKSAVIIISHRLSTLMQADQIMVLKNGGIEEMGSHEELLKHDGSYRRIFEMQSQIDEEIV